MTVDRAMFWVAFALLAVGPLRSINTIVCDRNGPAGVAASVAHAVLCVLCCVWLWVRFQNP